MDAVPHESCLVVADERSSIARITLPTMWVGTQDGPALPSLHVTPDHGTQLENILRDHTPNRGHAQLYRVS